MSFITLLNDSASFNPRSLFAAGEVGAWYDPSDLTTLFQDAAGTTPVTAAGQVVGLVLDKSRGLALGPELVTNGDFSNGTTGWATLNGSGSVAGGVYTFTPNATFGGPRQNITLVVGRTYQITATVSGNALARVYVNGTSGPTTVVTGTTSPRTLSFVSLATSTAGEFVVDSGNNTTPFTIDNISVRELPGNHATQSGATSVRPIYAVEPATGRRNLLTFTEQFDNAVWFKVNASVTANADNSPQVNATADKVIPNTTSTTEHYLAGSVGNFIGQQVCFSYYAKAAGYEYVSTLKAGGTHTIFNLSAGTVVTTAAGHTGVSITPVGDGWFRCSLVITSVLNGNEGRIYVSNNDSASAYAGDGTSGVYIWGAQLELGSTATAYQRVVSTYEVTESGVASRHYLAFDGIDDWLQTSTITPGTDKAQVVAGVRKLSDAAGGVVCDLNGATATGAIMLRAPVGASATYGFYSGGSVTFAGAITSGTFAAPLTSVLTGIGDIAADTQIIRVNGAQAATSAADQGTGNYSTLPLYVGRRQGAALPFNGNLYGLIVRFGANLSTSQISNAERWMGRKTGVTI